MKKILIIFCFLAVSDIAYSFEYTDNDRDMFYDAFIEGYVQEMTKAVKNLNIDENKKEIFLKEFIKQINKTELINSSWQCIQKYPVNQIITASVVCTQDWNKMQTEKSRKIFEEIKQE